MLLFAEAAHEAGAGAMKTVFTIYFAFWTFVIVALYVAVGFLLKKQDRLVEQHRREHARHH
jgi:hypothetical protein